MHIWGTGGRGTSLWGTSLRGTRGPESPMRWLGPRSDGKLCGAALVVYPRNWHLLKVVGTRCRPTDVSKSKSTGQSGKTDKKASPFADRRVIALAVLIVAIAGYYIFGWWSGGQARAAARSKLVSDTVAELQKDQPASDKLSKLMAGIARLPDALTASDLLAAQARIELHRGRPERAENLFGAIAASPTASAEDQSLGSRILMAKHEGFGGDKVQAKTMLEQVLIMSERAYGETRDVQDLFRAWQAATRLWDSRSGELAGQLQANHAESPESLLAQLSKNFEPVSDRDVVAQLIVDFATQPAELRAMQTIVTVHNDDLPGALSDAQSHLIASAGTPCVRIALAYVLHICATGHPAESADRTVFVNRRNVQLDWLDARAPVEKRAKWQPMRQLR